MAKRVKVILRDRVYIPRESVDLRRVRMSYEHRHYDEQACKKCWNFRRRHNETCDGCESYKGMLALWSKAVDKDGKEYVAVPSGSLENVATKTGVDITDPDEVKVVDRRPQIPFTSKLKFVKPLRDGSPDEDGNPRPDQYAIVADWLAEAKKNNVGGFIKAPPRSGKCLEGATIVNTQHGWSHFEEIISRKGYHEVDWTIDSHKGRRQVSHTYKEKSETLRLRTRNGFEICGTPEHPLLVLCPDLTLKWIPLSEISSGDYIVSQTTRNEPIWPENDEINPTRAAILGYLTANGRQGTLCSGDERVIRRFTRLVRREFGVEPRSVEMKGLQYMHLPKEARAWLLEIGYAPERSADKSIPLEVRRSSKRVMTAFLSAYLECDSGSNGLYIDLVTASPKLAHELHVILYHGYGILGRRTTVLKSATNSKNPVVREYQTIKYTGENAALLVSTFPSAKVARRAVENGRMYKASGQDFEVDHVPYLPRYLNGVIAPTRRGAQVMIDGHYTHYPWPFPDWRCPDQISRKSLREIDWPRHLETLRGVDKTARKRIARIVNSGMKFELVEDVSPDGRKWVYDVTVPDGHAFTANGVVSHNTVLGVYLTCELQVKTFITASQIDYLRQFCKRFGELTNLKEIVKGRAHKSPVVLVDPDPNGWTQDDGARHGVRVVKSWSKEILDADVILGGYQSFIIKPEGPKRAKRYINKRFSFVVVDEADQAAATAFAGFLNRLPMWRKLALTATVIRKDGLETVSEDILGRVIAVGKTTSLRPKISLWETGLKIYDYKQWHKLEASMRDNKERNAQIVRQVFIDLRKNPNNSILIPVNQTQHVQNLTRMINHQALVNRSKGENWPKDIAIEFRRGVNRDHVMNAVNRGERRVVVAISRMVKRGLDVPAWTHVYVGVIPTSNGPNFYQLASRVATPKPGKKTSIVRIMVDQLGASIYCLRSLANAKPDGILPGLKADPPVYKMKDSQKARLQEIIRFPKSYSFSDAPDENRLGKKRSEREALVREKAVPKMRSF